MHMHVCSIFTSLADTSIRVTPPRTYYAHPHISISTHMYTNITLGYSLHMKTDYLAVITSTIILAIIMYKKNPIHTQIHCNSNTN